jgi:hypothetical protein
MGVNLAMWAKMRIFNLFTNTLRKNDRTLCSFDSLPLETTEPVFIFLYVNNAIKYNPSLKASSCLASQGISRVF